MTMPERIWAFDAEPKGVVNMSHWVKASGIGPGFKRGSYIGGAEYIRADTLAERAREHAAAIRELLAYVILDDEPDERLAAAAAFLESLAGDAPVERET